jgi:hypothetical protein
MASKAIKAGLLTEDERDMICRAGTRKRNYWCRHLRDLQEILRRRQDETHLHR